MPLKSELLTSFQFPTQGKPDYDYLYVHSFCNEDGITDVLPQLKQKRTMRPGGIGLVVGSGGVFSWLPHLDLDGVIIMDTHPVVLGVTKIVGASIVGSDNPTQARERIFKYFPYNLYEVDPEHPISPMYIKKSFEKQFDREVDYFDQTHWTNPDAFEQTKQAVQATTTTFAQRDIRSIPFYYELRGVLESIGLPLTYVNFSNVHLWINSNKPLLEIAELVDPNGVIQFSNPGFQKAPLTVTLAESLDDFRKRTIDF